MRNILLMPFLAFLGILSLSGQLNILHNHYRPGDVLIKQQVEFVEPGSEGINKVWNFSEHPSQPLPSRRCVNQATS
jgi:hypothetical protein